MVKDVKVKALHKDYIEPYVTIDDEPRSKGELIYREDAIQAIKAYLDLCCLTEAKFHKGFEDYNDEIAREIISVIVEPNNNEKYRCYKCSWWDYDQGSQTMYKINCNGIAWKTEPSKIEDEPQTERSK